MIILYTIIYLSATVNFSTKSIDSRHLENLGLLHRPCHARWSKSLGACRWRCLRWLETPVGSASRFFLPSYLGLEHALPETNIAREPSQMESSLQTKDCSGKCKIWIEGSTTAVVAEGVEAMVENTPYATGTLLATWNLNGLSTMYHSWFRFDSSAGDAKEFRILPGNPTNWQYSAVLVRHRSLPLKQVFNRGKFLPRVWVTFQPIVQMFQGNLPWKCNPECWGTREHWDQVAGETTPWGKRGRKGDDGHVVRGDGHRRRGTWVCWVLLSDRSDIFLMWWDSAMEE